MILKLMFDSLAFLDIVAPREPNLVSRAYRGALKAHGSRTGAAQLVCAVWGRCALGQMLQLIFEGVPRLRMSDKDPEDIVMLVCFVHTSAVLLRMLTR